MLESENLVMVISNKFENIIRGEQTRMYMYNDFCKPQTA